MQNFEGVRHRQCVAFFSLKSDFNLGNFVDLNIPFFWQHPPMCIPHMHAHAEVDPMLPLLPQQCNAPATTSSCQRAKVRAPARGRPAATGLTSWHRAHDGLNIIKQKRL
eukprot:3023743-Amphidinium_carterae.1